MGPYFLSLLLVVTMGGSPSHAGDSDEAVVYLPEYDMDVNVRSYIAFRNTFDRYVSQTAAGIIFQYDISDIFNDDLLFDGPTLEEVICKEWDYVCNLCKESASIWTNVRNNYTNLRTELAQILQDGIHPSDNFPSSSLTEAWRRTLGTDEKKWVAAMTEIKEAEPRDCGHDVLLQVEDLQSFYTTQILKNLQSQKKSEDQLVPWQAKYMKQLRVETKLEYLAYRMKSSIELCRRRKGSFLFRDPQLLTQALEKMAERLSKQGYRLAFQPRNVDAYNLMPIADCFFTKSTMRIVLNVPVVREGNNVRFTGSGTKY